MINEYNVKDITTTNNVNDTLSVNVITKKGDPDFKQLVFYVNDIEVFRTANNIPVFIWQFIGAAKKAGCITIPDKWIVADAWKILCGSDLEPDS